MSPGTSSFQDSIDGSSTESNTDESPRTLEDWYISKDSCSYCTDIEASDPGTSSFQDQ